MLSPQTASPASWNPPTAGGDTTDDEEGPRPAPRADEFDAAEAYRIGIVHRSCPNQTDQSKN